MWVGGASCPSEEGFASQQTHVQVTGIWRCQSCQNPPLALQGYSQHATGVEDPGILGANIVKMSKSSRRPPQPGLLAWGSGQASQGHPFALSQRPQRPVQHGALPSPAAPLTCTLPCFPGARGRNVLLLVITAVEFSSCARRRGEHFMVFPLFHPLPCDSEGAAATPTSW